LEWFFARAVDEPGQGKEAASKHRDRPAKKVPSRLAIRLSVIEGEWTWTRAKRILRKHYYTRDGGLRREVRLLLNHLSRLEIEQGLTFRQGELMQLMIDEASRLDWETPDEGICD